MKEKLVVIVGPTAVGKTALSIEVAKKFNGEVISGDSMQIYKGLDIGTAKVTEAEKAGIPHYMIDILDPVDSFSVADFQKQVQENIDRIQEKDKLPVIAGGTGLYIQSVLYDYQFAASERSNEYHEQIEMEMERDGIDSVYQRLMQIDPLQAEKIHPNNRRRLIRALEVYDRTGMTMTEYQQKQQEESRYDFRIIGLEMDRPLLYERINQRVDQMVEEGLIEEVRRLYQAGLENTQAMRGIGYKEILPYLKGEQSLEEAINNLKRNSRRFAKRQYTWFKNKMPVDWYSITVETKNQVFQNILADLEGFYKET
ncbi:tRNA (adenosine(37)-N6)-dimethylallyltransferase MiaA [Gracilibacillus thailandensis]|uniref:tRNA dimethylallyltransferase n=1 Tax=Gracilibacillus thailandensis TaxID=563735 RepID=A0A6N7R2M9_9BACI|nr:tRNA (adenosine(37)-N6)-dimethylallyltransferase MiaA [Gracilibacillus thailandensis]MRI65386.1 tRNA (adenosine(37)-N6)-dimethylallyltransferase MiaA [Gracilibacillus thailandensis]